MPPSPPIPLLRDPIRQPPPLPENSGPMPQGCRTHDRRHSPCGAAKEPNPPPSLPSLAFLHANTPRRCGCALTRSSGTLTAVYAPRAPLCANPARHYLLPPLPPSLLVPRPCPSLSPDHDPHLVPSAHQLPGTTTGLASSSRPHLRRDGGVGTRATWPCGRRRVLRTGRPA